MFRPETVDLIKKSVLYTYSIVGPVAIIVTAVVTDLLDKSHAGRMQLPL